jgi:hypothetical protein
MDRTVLSLLSEKGREGEFIELVITPVASGTAAHLASEDADERRIGRRRRHC